MARQSAIRTAANLLRHLWYGPASLLRAWRSRAHGILKNLPGVTPSAGTLSTRSGLGSAPDAAAKPVAAAPVPDSEPQTGPATLPDGLVVYAVGDVHGRADLLDVLFKRIDADARKSDATPHLVMLGDYIDRGFQSRQVIDYLMSDKLSRFETYFLKGNHEEALLRFLEQPEHGPEWANYGGRETLVSYGVRPPRSLTMNDEWRTAHDQFIEKFPDTHLHFMRGLELSVRLGGYGFAHAGVRPGRAFDQQEEHDLLWIRDEFLNSGDRDDVVVVHGHTPADDAYNDFRRINVDTGAYFSGRLTAVRLERDQISFLKTR